MSCNIFLGEQNLWICNQQLDRLLKLALRLCDSTTLTDEEKAWVSKLREFDTESWSGMDFDLEERFPTIPEKKFWSVIYHNVARRVFLRELGSHDTTYWQSSVIGDAYFIARLLTSAVQKTEQTWLPKTENSDELSKYR